MKQFQKENSSSIQQFSISISLVIGTAAACYFASSFLDYKMVALILMMTVSLIAILFDILPVLIAAFMSALIWNFFFIPPKFTFHIDKGDDVLMFLMYFIIASVNAVLTNKIRKAEKFARDKEEKEKAINLYNHILNSLSHELRTPIATIIGAVDTLKDRKINIENQSELLNEIDKASIRLNTQVENLLNMNRLETGMLKLNLDWCDINELIYTVIYKFESSTHQIVFESNELLPLFKLDVGLIEEVISNLISNAIQYTPDNTCIVILANLHEEKLQIEIIDEGEGFPEEMLPMIFEKFYRLPNTKAGGTGLGLTIAKGYVQAHSGNINVENIKPHGAKFTILLPAKRSYINNLKNE